MRTLKHLFEQNRQWAGEMTEKDPGFFARLSVQQSPEYLWIGCSDSRVPANQIIDLPPGEVFVHRNVANLVVHSDLNTLSVIQYAVDVLRVEHIIVCGHYGCGGVQAVMEDRELGLADNWLRHLRDIRDKHAQTLGERTSDQERTDLLCELNVIEQVYHVCQTSVVQNAWKRGQDLAVHGWVYRLTDGLIHDLDVCTLGVSEAKAIHDAALTQRGAAL